MPTSIAGRSTKLTGSAGFTLIEISVVVLLLGIFALLVTPRLHFSSAAQLSSTARRLGDTSRYLLNEAALSGLEHRLVYNLDEGSYQAMVLESNGELMAVSGTGRGTRLGDEVRFIDVTVPGRGTYTEGEVITRIYPSGWQEEAVVHLENRRGEQLTVRLSPLSGLAETFDGYRDFR